MEKQAYALVKATKTFKPYFVGAKVIAYVPHAVMKYVFVQIEMIGKRCRWINRIQEFNMEIQITKLVRGQGQAKLMAEANIQANQICNVGNEDGIVASIEHTPWYTNILHYLIQMKCHEGLNDNQRRTLNL